MNNHVIDPTFFNDCIAEFAFEYDMYSENGVTHDEFGRVHHTWTKTTISGSLQSQGTNKTRNKTGNIAESKYNFYCKSMYRIAAGDFINYKNKWLKVGPVQDYDEYGVRSCEVEMINLAAYKDFSDYVDYINGTKII